MLLFCSFWTQSLKSLPKQGKNACEVLWFLYYRTIALCVCIWSTSWQLYLTVKIYYYKSTLKLLLHDFCTENRVSDEAFLKIKKINLIQIYCYCLTIAEMHPRFIKNEDCKDGLLHSQYKHRLQLRREKKKQKKPFPTSRSSFWLSSVGLSQEYTNTPHAIASASTQKAKPSCYRAATSSITSTYWVG